MGSQRILRVMHACLPISAILAISVGLTASLTTAQSDATAKLTSHPDVRPLPPLEAMARIETQPGYRLELVASEPMVEEPALAAWDGNGRMYVAEMRTYMQDIDGKGALEPRSRIVLLDDTDGDGSMDRRSVFADKLILPRMILTLHDGILIRETNTLDLWWLRDTDGDGKSDWRKKVFEGGNRGGNLEHQPSVLLWAIDNRLYVTYTSRRYRWEGDKIVAEPLAGGDGQWGLCQDDVGQIYYSRAGGERPAISFQQNMQYGKLDLPGQLAPGFSEVWPIDKIPDVQGGLRRVREDGTLNHFTGCCGQVIFRGDHLPHDAYGDLFIPEPVGRLVRRAKVTEVNGVKVLTNAYEKSEFLRTKDANFRPINMYTAPDGTMYVIDMYRGIIQEGNWVREGSYLRGVVQKYGLDRNIGRGRIYRVVHENHQPGPRPRMLDESPVQLVTHLSHPNGWWRDEAQKLLVLRADRSVVPMLERLVLSDSKPLTRLHALWTLDGLGSMSTTLLIKAMTDDDPRLRAAAIRISEPYLGAKKRDPKVLAAVLALETDSDAGVVAQFARTTAYVKLPDHDALLRRISKAHPEDRRITTTVKTHFDRIEKARKEAVRLAAIAEHNAEVAASVKRGKGHYQTLCFACHGADGKGMPIPDQKGSLLAPTLIGSPRVLGHDQRLVRIVLHGLTGPVDKKNYPGQMLPMTSYDDTWIADVITYLRKSWGNKGEDVTAETIGSIRKQTADRKTPWTLEELRPFDPVLVARSSWKLSASHRSKRSRMAVDGNEKSNWNSGTQQVPNMWFAVELSRELKIEAVRLSAGKRNQSPESCRVELSSDGKRWKTAIEHDKVTTKALTLKFPPQQARFIRIRQTGSRKGDEWTIAELELYGELHPLRDGRAKRAKRAKK